MICFTSFINYLIFWGFLVPNLIPVLDFLLTDNISQMAYSSNNISFNNMTFIQMYFNPNFTFKNMQTNYNLNRVNALSKSRIPFLRHENDIIDLILKTFRIK